MMIEKENIKETYDSGQDLMPCIMHFKYKQGDFMRKKFVEFCVLKET